MLHSLKLREILSRDPICVTAATPLLEVMAEMHTLAVTGVVVVADKRPVGILTERDILRVIATGLQPEALNVENVMTCPVITAPHHQDFFEAYHLCAQKNIRHLIVTDDAGEIFGIATESDFLRALGVDVMTDANTVEKNMTRQPLLFSPESHVLDAIRCMSSDTGSAVIATIDGKPVGILTERDVVHLGLGQISGATTLAEVMTQPVLTVPVNTSVYYAIDLMRTRRVRRIGVVDDDGRIIGLLTEHDIVKRIENHYVDFLSSIIVRQMDDINRARRQLNESAVLTSILRESLDMALVATDMDGTVRYINPDAASLMGLSPIEAIGHPLIELIRQAGLDDHQILAGIEKAREGDRHLFEVVRGKSDTVQVLRSHIAPILDESATPLGFVQTLQDVTERKRAEEALRQAASIFENTVEGVIVANPEGNIESVNPAFTKITGYTEDEVRGKNPKLLSSGRHDAKFYRRMWQHLATDGYWQGEVLNRRKNGEIYAEWLSLSVVCEPNGNVKNYIGVFSDITSLKRSQENFEYLAHHDTLTQLPNRLLLNARMEHALIRAKRDSEKVAILMIDLDNFKPVNDTYGHLVGDGLLQAVAKRLLTIVRSEDTPARLGGDEFVVLLEAITEDGADEVAKKLIRGLSEPYVIEQYSISVSVSIGIALSPVQGENVQELMRQADNALYQVKTSGRNGYCFYQG